MLLFICFYIIDLMFWIGYFCIFSFHFIWIIFLLFPLVIIIIANVFYISILL